MSLRETLSSCWQRFQDELFPWLGEAVGPLSERHKQFVMVLDLSRVEALTRHWHGLPGRPPSERAALARAFVAKAVFQLATTALLIDRLAADKTLRRLCGWERGSAVPSESTFSRAFAEFAESALPTRLHEALVAATQADRLVGHISRDSLAIEAREKAAPAPAPKPAPAPETAVKRKRRRKGEMPPAKPPRAIERQVNMSFKTMLAELPRQCAKGVKRNAKGFKESWIGYKLHLDVADGGIPISAILTSASVHDSQVAIPLATMTAARVTSLYDVMDSAYDDALIRSHSRSLGHVPIIDVNPRSTRGKHERALEAQRRQLLGIQLAEERRYDERTTAERANSRIMDHFGGRTVRVRGNAKVMCHLMFGVLALTAEQLLRLVT
jgi:Transposase DDE domain/Transposase domain (DUF772)